MASIMTVRKGGQVIVDRGRKQDPTVHRWRTFTVASAISVAALAVFVAWIRFGLGGERTNVAVGDIAFGVVAIAAAGMCAWSAHTTTGPRALSGWLLTAMAAAWGVGEAIKFTHDFGLGVAVSSSSAVDAARAAAYLLAAAAVVAVPAAPSRLASRGRTWLDGGTIALSLVFVSLALGPGKQFHPYSHEWVFAQHLGLGYPLGDMLIVTLVVLAIRRNAHSSRGKLLLWLAGLAVIALTDGTGSLVFQSNGTASAGFIAGFMLIGLSRLWPASPANSSDSDAPVTLWQMAVPWMALVLVLATSVLATVTGHGLNNSVIAPSAGLVVLLMVSQLLTYRESLSLLVGSKRAEAQLQERTTLLNQIYISAPLGIARMGPDMKIVGANPMFAGLLRVPADALVGRIASDFVPSEDLAGLSAKLSALADGSVPSAEGDLLARRGDGSQVWLHWSATAVRNVRGSVEYFLGTFEDITAKHEAERLALASLAGLERLNRLKSEFVSMVSHEFRTGLVGIQGFSEVIRDEELEPGEAKTFADDINKDAMRLNRMISEMLDLDRMESGRMALQLSPQDMNATIRETVERAGVTSDKHSIVTDLDPNQPSVRADSDRLIQVMTNLLSNAIKYSPAGGEILVSSRLENGSVHVRVRDHGLGIPPEYIDKLFGRYERFEQTHPTKIMGTGLGLAITRQIVEMHGGKIWAESNLGSGSEFHFTIPTSVSAANVSSTAVPATVA